MAEVDSLDFEARRTERFFVGEIQIFEDEAMTTPMDLSGEPLWMQVRERPELPPVLQLSTANGQLAIVDGPQGIVSIDIAAAVLMPIPIGSYYQDMTMRNVDNTVLWTGTFTLMPGITREPGIGP